MFPSGNPTYGTDNSSGGYNRPPPDYSNMSSFLKQNTQANSTHHNKVPTPGYQYTESEPVDEDDFLYGPTLAQADFEIRRNFVKKVYSILTLQLLGTAFFSYIFYATESIQLFLFRNQWFVITSCLLAFGNLLALIWKRRSYPTNFVLLSTFTFLESISLGTVVSFYSTRVVLQALFLTLGIFLILTLFASQSKYDFSSWLPYLSGALWILVLLSFVQIFFPFSSGFEFIVALGSAGLFSAYILVDTYMIMNRMSPEDYIIASVELYLDIINLFLALLRLFSSEDD